MKFTWMHYALFACTVLSGACEALAHYAQAGNALPFHLGAGGLMFATMLFGTLSKSMLPPTVPSDPPADPPVKP